mmetsp:Transcript_11157/g.33289  ORF Transcript_11157/g.33289 Transcript_11157/m.33289 type:complete len:298 (+) Transcript_11157:158-1051(+)
MAQPSRIVAVFAIACGIGRADHAGFGDDPRIWDIGDGVCDEALNTPDQKFDGGDCCASTCRGSRCGLEGFACLDPTVSYRPWLAFVDPTLCPTAGDGICNRETNTRECVWDRGDCCYLTCQGPNCGKFACADPVVHALEHEKERKNAWALTSEQTFWLVMVLFLLLLIGAGTVLHIGQARRRRTGRAARRDAPAEKKVGPKEREAAAAVLDAQRAPSAEVAATCTCSICLSDLGEDAVVLACGHVFDRACLVPWFSRILAMESVLTCPLCRSDVEATRDVEAPPGGDDVEAPPAEDA